MMTTRASRAWAVVIGALLVGTLGASPARADMVTITFDELAGGYQPGDVYADRGVVFTTVTIPDAVAVGDTITVTELATDIFLETSINAISLWRHAAERFKVTNDVLMAFSSPVLSVELATDDTVNEPAADIVRLLILAPTANPNEFTVLAIDEGWDNATAAPDNLLGVDLGGTAFSYALFQATTESEYFDNLQFDQISVPPPYIAVVGFSDQPYGDQDVTEFLHDETLHVYVRDVDLDALDPDVVVWVDLRGKAPNKKGKAKSFKVVQVLAPLPDGGFGAQIPLDQLLPGTLDVMLYGLGGPGRSGVKLLRESVIVVNPGP